MPDTEGRRVNAILHTLRGEQFRHQRNVQARTLRVKPTVSNLSRLPFDFLTLDLGDTPGQVVKTWSGPTPPKSWQSKGSDGRSPHDASTRARLLSVVLSRLPSVKSNDAVPPLSLLCLRIIASEIPKDEFDQVLPYISPHLRCQLMHDTAIHAPLSNAKLYALAEPDDHVDGQLFVIGPIQTLPNDFFLRRENRERVASETREWDSEDLEWATKPFHTLVLLATALPTSTLLTLPPTLTHLGLINLSKALPLHRLPNVCPTLVVLDLSCNSWLHPSDPEAAKILDRVPWSRWKGLEVLGMRECHLDDSLMKRINHGRWDDVQIVQ
ncbi:hypothetical protein BDZ89DRAFT_1153491 [Hymenopellis radicata]|nr:hypothetical protein BDZ89DRAFT_1153491 [Hymenopellis radicata]